MSNSEKVIVKYAFFSPTLGLSFQMQNQDLIVVDTDGKCENSGTLMDEYYIPSDQSDEDEEDEPIVVAKESVCPSPKKDDLFARLATLPQKGATLFSALPAGMHIMHYDSDIEDDDDETEKFSNNNTNFWQRLQSQPPSGQNGDQAYASEANAMAPPPPPPSIPTFTPKKPPSLDEDGNTYGSFFHGGQEDSLLNRLSQLPTKHLPPPPPPSSPPPPLPPPPSQRSRTKEEDEDEEEIKRLLEKYGSGRKHIAEVSEAPGTTASTTATTPPPIPPSDMDTLQTLKTPMHLPPPPPPLLSLTNPTTTMNTKETTVPPLTSAEDPFTVPSIPAAVPSENPKTTIPQEAMKILLESAELFGHQHKKLFKYYHPPISTSDKKEDSTFTSKDHYQSLMTQLESFFADLSADATSAIPKDTWHTKKMECMYFDEDIGEYILLDNSMAYEEFFYQQKKKLLKIILSPKPIIPTAQSTADDHTAEKDGVAPRSPLPSVATGSSSVLKSTVTNNNMSTNADDFLTSLPPPPPPSTPPQQLSATVPNVSSLPPPPPPPPLSPHFEDEEEKKIVSPITGNSAHSLSHRRASVRRHSFIAGFATPPGPALSSDASASMKISSQMLLRECGLFLGYMQSTSLAAIASTTSNAMKCLHIGWMMTELLPPKQSIIYRINGVKVYQSVDHSFIRLLLKQPVRPIQLEFVITPSLSSTPVAAPIKMHGYKITYDIFADLFATTNTKYKAFNKLRKQLSSVLQQDYVEYAWQKMITEYLLQEKSPTPSSKGGAAAGKSSDLIVPQMMIQSLYRYVEQELQKMDLSTVPLPSLMNNVSTLIISPTSSTVRNIAWPKSWEILSNENEGSTLVWEEEEKRRIALDECQHDLRNCIEKFFFLKIFDYTTVILFPLFGKLDKYGNVVTEDDEEENDKRDDTANEEEEETEDRLFPKPKRILGSIDMKLQYHLPAYFTSHSNPYFLNPSYLLLPTYVQHFHDLHAISATTTMGKHYWQNIKLSSIDDIELSKDHSLYMKLYYHRYFTLGQLGLAYPKLPSSLFPASSAVQTRSRKNIWLGEYENMEEGVDHMITFHHQLLQQEEWYQAIKCMQHILTLSLAPGEMMEALVKCINLITLALEAHFSNTLKTQLLHEEVERTSKNNSIHLSQQNDQESNTLESFDGIGCTCGHMHLYTCLQCNTSNSSENKDEDDHSIETIASNERFQQYVRQHSIVCLRQVPTQFVPSNIPVMSNTSSTAKQPLKSSKQILEKKLPSSFTISADDLLPGIVWILCQCSAVNRLQAIDAYIWYMQEFRHAELFHGEEAFAFMQFSSAVAFVKKLSKQSYDIPKTLPSMVMEHRKVTDTLVAETNATNGYSISDMIEQTERNTERVNNNDPSSKIALPNIGHNLYNAMIVMQYSSLQILLACKTGDIPRFQYYYLTAPNPRLLLTSTLSPDMKDNLLTACIKYNQYALFQQLFDASIPLLLEGAAKSFTLIPLKQTKNDHPSGSMDLFTKDLIPYPIDSLPINSFVNFFTVEDDYLPCQSSIGGTTITTAAIGSTAIKIQKLSELERIPTLMISIEYQYLDMMLDLLYHGANVQLLPAKYYQQSAMMFDDEQRDITSLLRSFTVSIHDLSTTTKEGKKDDRIGLGEKSSDWYKVQQKKLRKLYDLNMLSISTTQLMYHIVLNTPSSNTTSPPPADSSVSDSQVTKNESSSPQPSTSLLYVKEHILLLQERLMTLLLSTLPVTSKPNPKPHPSKGLDGIVTPLIATLFQLRSYNFLHPKYPLFTPLMMILCTVNVSMGKIFTCFHELSAIDVFAVNTEGETVWEFWLQCCLLFPHSCWLEYFGVLLQLFDHAPINATGTMGSGYQQFRVVITKCQKMYRAYEMEEFSKVYKKNGVMEYFYNHHLSPLFTSSSPTSSSASSTTPITLIEAYRASYLLSHRYQSTSSTHTTTVHTKKEEEEKRILHSYKHLYKHYVLPRHANSSQGGAEPFPENQKLIDHLLTMSIHSSIPIFLPSQAGKVNTVSTAAGAVGQNSKSWMTGNSATTLLRYCFEEKVLIALKHLLYINPYDTNSIPIFDMITHYFTPPPISNPTSQPPNSSSTNINIMSHLHSDPFVCCYYTLLTYLYYHINVNISAPKTSHTLLFSLIMNIQIIPTSPVLLHLLLQSYTLQYHVSPMSSYYYPYLHHHIQSIRSSYRIQFGGKPFKLSFQELDILYQEKYRAFSILHYAIEKFTTPSSSSSQTVAPTTAIAIASGVPTTTTMLPTEYRIDEEHIVIIGWLLQAGVNRLAMNKQGVNVIDYTCKRFYPTGQIPPVTTTHFHTPSDEYKLLIYNMLRYDPTQISISLASKHNDWTVMQSLFLQGIDINHQQLFHHPITTTTPAAAPTAASPVKTTTKELHAISHELYTPLLASCYYGHATLAMKLLAIPLVDVNLGNLLGHTPLMYAVYQQSEPAVLQLLRLGAKRESPDSAGKIAKDYAMAIHDKQGEKTGIVLSGMPGPSTTSSTTHVHSLMDEKTRKLIAENIANILLYDPTMYFIHDLIRYNYFSGVIAMLKQQVNVNHVRYTMRREEEEQVLQELGGEKENRKRLLEYSKKVTPYFPIPHAHIPNATGMIRSNTTSTSTTSSPPSSTSNSLNPVTNSVTKEFIPGETPLIVAAKYHRLEIFTLLLKAPDINVNLPDAYGWTALFHATYQQHEEMVITLLQYPSIQRNIPDETTKQYTAYQIAAQVLHNKPIAMLLACDPLIMSLHDMCAAGNVLEVAALLKQQVSPITRDHRQGNKFYLQTPLIAAARYGQCEIIKMLLRISEVLQHVSDVDQTGKTALMHAAAIGALDVTKVLLNAGCDRNAVDKQGLSAKDHASRHSYSIMIQFMSQLMIR